MSARCISTDSARGRVALLLTLLAISVSNAFPSITSSTTRVSKEDADARAAADPRLDVALRILLTRAGEGAAKQVETAEAGTVLEARPASSTGIPVMIRGEVSRAHLEAAGVQPETQAGSVTTASVCMEDLAALLEVPGVQYVECAAALTPQLDVSTSEIEADAVWDGTPPNYSGYTGRNVIIGIVDTGIDLTHPDFRISASQTRIKYLWDQTGLGNPPSGFTYGTEWSQAQINAGASNEIDDNGHGSHIAGIAAGNGRATGNGQPAYRYVGVAPEADLVVVKSKLLLESQILDGVNYVFQKAAALGRDAVVLLAVGNERGAHDGSSSLDAGLSALTGPGKLVVVAAGNYGNQPIHSHVNLGAAGSATITFTIPAYSASPNPEYLDIEGWHNSTAAFKAKLTSPTGQTSNWVNPGVEFTNLTCSDGAFRIQNGTLTNSKGAKQLRVFIWDSDPTLPPRPGTWTLEVQRQSGTTSGVLDAWISDWVLGSGGVAPAFTSQVDYARTVANGATADSVISAGAYTTKVQWINSSGSTSSFSDHPAMQTLAVFSGQGPRRDGVQRPDVAAPGQGVAAALSAAAIAISNTKKVQDGVHWVNRGTSAAAAHVAGSLALLLQESPRLTPSAARIRIKQRARSDSFTGTVPNGAWGAGKLDLVISITGVGPRGNPQLAMSAAFPNPGREMTTFGFVLPPDLGSEEKVQLRIMDVRGRVVTTLRGNSIAGPQQLVWNGRAASGEPAPAGIYIARLEAGARSAMQKFVRLPAGFSSSGP